MLTDLQSGASESSTSEVRLEVSPEVPAITTPADDPQTNDPRANADLRTLIAGCGVYPLDTRSKIFLTGEDRTRWLNGMITNNVRDLAPGHGVYTFLLNAQGKIQGDLYAFNRGETIVLDTDREQLSKLLEIFDHFIVMDDVNVKDASDRLTALGVQGPKTAAVLLAAGIDVPELAPLQFADLKWQDFEITLLRAEAWKGAAYELWLDPANAPALLEALRKAGATPVGAGAQRLYRMASGIPLFGEDIRERDLPQETGQERALHFTKGCYVGQEIVERIRSRGQVHRVFSGFELTAPAAPGDKIAADGKDVGEITSTASIQTPAGKTLIALGYLRREAFNKPLTIHGVPLQRHKLPFQELLQA